MKMLVGVLALAIVAIGAVVAPSGASGAVIMTFTGSDAGAGPADPRPNSNAAALAFDTAAGGLGVVTINNFESVAIQHVTAAGVAIGGGVTISMTNPDLVATDQGITAATNSPLTLGY